jgi:predicted dehydrogenase
MLNLGIVDFDSSHAVEFTRRINRCAIAEDQFVEGAQILYGYPGGAEQARDRIELHSQQVIECGVELVSDPREMIGKIDGVLILSVQGDRHLEMASPFLEAGIPTYIDKPISCRLEDLDRLIALAGTHQTMLWSGSAARFADDVITMADKLKQMGPMTGVQVFGPAHESFLNRGLFHYGIHITETMFALMGCGCERISALTSADCDLVGARWSDGRIASIRGHRKGNTGYGFTCFTSQGLLHRNISLRTSYRNLCREIVASFQSGVPPVSLDETREIIRFLDAAESSRHQNGHPVPLN